MHREPKMVQKWYRNGLKVASEGFKTNANKMVPKYYKHCLQGFKIVWYNNCLKMVSEGFKTDANPASPPDITMLTMAVLSR